MLSEGLVPGSVEGLGDQFVATRCRVFVVRSNQSIRGNVACWSVERGDEVDARGSVRLGCTTDRDVERIELTCIEILECAIPKKRRLRRGQRSDKHVGIGEYPERGRLTATQGPYLVEHRRKVLLDSGVPVSQQASSFGQLQARQSLNPIWTLMRSADVNASRWLLSDRIRSSSRPESTPSLVARLVTFTSVPSADAAALPYKST